MSTCRNNWGKLRFYVFNYIRICKKESKLNIIESKISKALIDNEISHEVFETIINEGKEYQELKESIRMMNSQRSDGEKVSLIEEGKKLGINEIIKRNEIINTSLK